MFSTSGAPFDAESEICAGYVSRRVRKHYSIKKGNGDNVTFHKMEHRLN